MFWATQRFRLMFSDGHKGQSDVLSRAKRQSDVLRHTARQSDVLNQAGMWCDVLRRTGRQSDVLSWTGKKSNVFRWCQMMRQHQRWVREAKQSLQQCQVGTSAEPLPLTHEAALLAPRKSLVWEAILHQPSRLSFASKAALLLPGSGRYYCQCLATVLWLTNCPFWKIALGGPCHLFVPDCKELLKAPTIVIYHAHEPAETRPSVSAAPRPVWAVTALLHSVLLPGSQDVETEPDECTDHLYTSHITQGNDKQDT